MFISAFRKLLSFLPAQFIAGVTACAFELFAGIWISSSREFQTLFSLKAGLLWVTIVSVIVYMTVLLILDVTSAEGAR